MGEGGREGGVACVCLRVAPFLFCLFILGTAIKA